MKNQYKLFEYNRGTSSENDVSVLNASYSLNLDRATAHNNLLVLSYV